jgi:stage V sporulation protein SpoVS
MVTVNSGAPEPDDRFQDPPRAILKLLLNAKRSFLGRRLNYDCRCLVQFCEEAEVVYEELGYASAEQMIREGYKLEPSQVELAVAWLRHNEPVQAIGIATVQAAIKAATAKKDLGKRGRKPKGLIDGNSINYDRGTTNENTLRRLARDNPELLDKIESGELSVNAAAISAGFRRKATPEEVCVKAFGKVENRLNTLKRIVGLLAPHERAVVRDWLEDDDHGG